MHKNGYSTRRRKISSSGRGKRRRRGEKGNKARKTGKAPKEKRERKRVVGALARVGEGDFHYQLVTTSELRRKG